MKENITIGNIMTHKRPGYLMLELLLVIGVVVAFLGFFYTSIYVPQQKSLMSKEDFKNQVVIKRIVNQYIKLVAGYNKSLYTSSSLVAKADFVELEPLSGDVAGKISFKMHKKIIDANAFMNKDLLTARCLKISEDVDYYNYRCLGVGSEISFLEVTKDDTIFNNIYTNQTPIFSLKKLVNGNFIGKNEFTYMDTYLMFREKSLEKLNILRKRLESFNRIVYVNEIGNPCSFEGGLDSWDDFNIPWIWKIHSQSDAQNEICYTPASTDPAVPPTISCSCDNYNDDTKWSTDPDVIMLDANEELDKYQRVLTNLSLPRSYKYDEVGNPISIILFSEINAISPTPLTATPPPAPIKNYKVDDTLSINSYRQGELFVRPAKPDGVSPEFMENSRIVYFYD